MKFFGTVQRTKACACHFFCHVEQEHLTFCVLINGSEFVVKIQDNSTSHTMPLSQATMQTRHSPVLHGPELTLLWQMSVLQWYF